VLSKLKHRFGTDAQHCLCDAVGVWGGELLIDEQCGSEGGVALDVGKI